VTRTALYWEDFVPGEIHEMGRHTFTIDEIIEFATKYDPQPIHIDPEAAKASFFGGLIASGWHTCSIGMRFAVDTYINSGISLGSPGVDNIRWLKPVRPGDTVVYRRITLASRPSRSMPNVGLVHVRLEATNQKGETVMTNEGWGMFGRRPTPSAESPLT
jgi:acyl dehydratase